MQITRDTICCISIAERPGNFGAQIFNAVFQELKMDYIYKPFKLAPGHLKEVASSVKALNIRGCGVSMPHKSAIMEHLDVIDPLAKKVGAVNTVVNDNGKLTGYNTDCVGALTALKEVFDAKGTTAHIVGAGGAARAIIIALTESGVTKISISNRDEARAKEIAKEFGIEYRSTSERSTTKADILVNATPVGMAPDINQMPITESEVGNYSVVMDVVVSPFQTKLTKLAEKKGLTIVPGYRMALYQGAAQFKLYTGKEAPLELMLSEMKKVVSKA